MLHPSLGILRSQFPAFTIWAMNSGERALARVGGLDHRERPQRARDHRYCHQVRSAGRSSLRDGALLVVAQVKAGGPPGVAVVSVVGRMPRAHRKHDRMVCRRVGTPGMRKSIVSAAGGLVADSTYLSVMTMARPLAS